MNMNFDAAGMAALSICESMLLSLTDLRVIEDAEALAILKDAAAGHRGALPTSRNPEASQAAADMIERIIKGKNSVPHDPLD